MEAVHCGLREVAADVAERGLEHQEDVLRAASLRGFIALAFFWIAIVFVGLRNIEFVFYSF